VREQHAGEARDITRAAAEALGGLLLVGAEAAQEGGEPLEGLDAGVAGEE